MKRSVARRTFAGFAAALLLASCAIVADAAPRADDESIRYLVTFAGRQNHYLEIEATIPCAGRAALELMLPVWTPGSYLVREYSRHIEALTAETAAGAPLLAEKTAKNRWRIAAVEAPSIVVRYRVYCHDLSVQGNWVDGEFAILNGAPTFITILDGLHRPHEVTLTLPAEWKHAITPLASTPAPDRVTAPHSFLAPNYDTLVDSPIYLGNAEPRPFSAAGRAHVFTHHGGGAIWDGADSVEDVRRIVEAHAAFWGCVPYDRYVFFNLVVEGSGGLEHMASTVMMTSRWNRRDRKKYIGWLGLVSHEFFHTWNVKRLRPAELGPFDYEREVYTKCLWIAEGITSYYDDLLLRRAGLITQKEYLEALSKQIETLQTTPGRQTQPLEQSSLDTWIKHYRKDENSANTAISYYVKGAIAGFLLDAEIRRATESARSLDDVMRLLYRRHSETSGYTSLDFRAAAEEVAEADLGEWFVNTLESTNELDYAGALEWYGLRFDEKRKDEDDEDAGAPTDGSPSESISKKDGQDDGAAPGSGNAKEKKKQGWLGLNTQDRGGRLVVIEVKRETPLHTHGVQVDDEILAIDGYRLLPGGVQARMEQYKPGDAATLLVARREQLVSIPVVFGEEPPKPWYLKPLPKPTPEQEAHLRNWLSLTETR